MSGVERRTRSHSVATAGTVIHDLPLPGLSVMYTKIYVKAVASRKMDEER